MVSWRLVPLFRGWFLSCCTCASLCLSLFLFGCFVPLSARCRCSLRPPCSLFLLVLCGLSFIWGVLFLLVVFLPGVCLLCFLSFGVLPLIPCPRSLSLRVFPRQVLFLLSLVASHRVGDLPALVAGVFLGGCPVPLSLLGSGDASVFRSYSPSLLSFVGSPSTTLLLCPFRALRLCFYRAASFPSCPRSLFLPPLSPSRSLSPRAFSFFFCIVLAWAISSTSRSLPSAPCSSCSSASSFSSLRPRSSLRLCGVRGLASSLFFSAVLLCLPYLWPILDLLLSFFLLPFRCSVLIIKCLWDGFPVSEEVLSLGVYMQLLLGLYL